jgi:hypothetical protein
VSGLLGWQRMCDGVAGRPWCNVHVASRISPPGWPESPTKPRGYFIIFDGEEQQYQWPHPHGLRHGATQRRGEAHTSLPTSTGNLSSRR